MKLSELFSNELAQEMAREGYIRTQVHPYLPLQIWNYTEQAQFQRVWNEVTLNCRGLISDFSGNIVARPFPKFFNDRENPGQSAGQRGQVRVTDKLDGSLGIMYVANEYSEPAIATRGSFESDQAKHANQILQWKYADWYPPHGITMLFEIIYPENRIVVDYGDQDDLVLLGGVHIDSGLSWGPECFPGWPGPRAEVLNHTSYLQALLAPPRPGKEGMVLFWPDTGLRIKMKQDDYVELHRIVTGLNERAIWERMARVPADEDSWDAVYDGIPDELHPWVFDVVERIGRQYEGMKVTALEVFNVVHGNWRIGLDDRGAFARDVKDFEPWLKTCMFLLLDGKDIDDFLWKQLRPVGETKRARITREDVA